MVKLLSILVLLLFVFGCKTEIVQVPADLDKDLSFLQGAWKWRESTYSFCTTCSGTQTNPAPTEGNYLSSKRFIYSHSSTVYATLSFNEKTVQINSSSVDTSMQLKLSGYTEIQGRKIITFRNGANEMIRLVYVPELNIIETEYLFFTFDKDACNTSFHILNNTYEKN